MSYFMQNGDAFLPTPGRESILETLPVGNYLVAKSMSGMFFQRAPMFTEPGKMYGNFDGRANRILNTFADRERATGVLLAGEKGTGKSQLARLISYKAYALGIPTILVNQPWAGDDFHSLLADVEQPAIVVMDEFEKVYGQQELQENILTLLDGTMTSKKLFILTVNDKFRINSHMKNRPGRLFYALDFDGLDASFVREYCEDNLNNHDHIDGVVTVSSMFEKFNFDILKALVEEMNRYEEDAFDAMEMLNAKPVMDSYVTIRYDVQVWDKDGKEVKVNETNIQDHPLTVRGGQMAIWASLDDQDESPFNNDQLLVNASHVRRLNGEKGIFEYVNDDGYRILFTKQEPKTYGLKDMTY